MCPIVGEGPKVKPDRGKKERKEEWKNCGNTEERKNGRIYDIHTFLYILESLANWHSCYPFHFPQCMYKYHKIIPFFNSYVLPFFHSSGFPSRPVSIIDHSSFLPFFRIFSLLSFHLSIFLGISAPESLKFNITWLKLCHKNGVLDNIFGCFGHLTSPKRSLTSPENSNALR